MLFGIACVVLITNGIAIPVISHHSPAHAEVFKNELSFLPISFENCYYLFLTLEVATFVYVGYLCGMVILHLWQATVSSNVLKRIHPFFYIASVGMVTLLCTGILHFVHVVQTRPFDLPSCTTHAIIAYTALFSVSMLCRTSCRRILLTTASVMAVTWAFYHVYSMIPDLMPIQSQFLDMLTNLRLELTTLRLNMNAWILLYWFVTFYFAFCLLLIGHTWLERFIVQEYVFWLNSGSDPATTAEYPNDWLNFPSFGTITVRLLTNQKYCSHPLMYIWHRVLLLASLFCVTTGLGILIRRWFLKYGLYYVTMLCELLFSFPISQLQMTQVMPCFRTLLCVGSLSLDILLFLSLLKVIHQLQSTFHQYEVEEPHQPQGTKLLEKMNNLPQRVHEVTSASTPKDEPPTKSSNKSKGKKKGNNQTDTPPSMPPPPKTDHGMTKSTSQSSISSTPYNCCKICKCEDLDTETIKDIYHASTSNTKFVGQCSLIHPCKCTGSMSLVHRHCLDLWRKHTVKPMQCEICGFGYQLKPVAVTFSDILYSVLSACQDASQWVYVWMAVMITVALSHFNGVTIFAYIQLVALRGNDPPFEIHSLNHFQDLVQAEQISAAASLNLNVIMLGFVVATLLCAILCMHTASLYCRYNMGSICYYNGITEMYYVFNENMFITLVKYMALAELILALANGLQSILHDVFLWVLTENRRATSLTMIQINLICVGILSISWMNTMEVLHLFKYFGRRPG